MSTELLSRCCWLCLWANTVVSILANGFPVNIKITFFQQLSWFRYLSASEILLFSYAKSRPSTPYSGPIHPYPFGHRVARRKSLVTGCRKPPGRSPAYTPPDEC